MIKYIFFLFTTSLLFAQPTLEVRLVNENIGRPQPDFPNGYAVYNGTSNDAGLNSILSNYNVDFYQDNNFHPYYGGRIKVIFGTFPTQFITDLLAYSSVIESVKISESYEFTDALTLKLLDLNVGAPTGFLNNIVTTNDAGLNAIFQSFNVIYYDQYLSNFNYFDVVCNCDNKLLVLALNNYASVIDHSYTLAGGTFLNKEEFDKKETKIFPNPFSSKLNIQTNEIVKNYNLIDITGKLILSTPSKNTIENNALQLDQGIYFLNLTLEDGNKLNFKIIKN